MEEARATIETTMGTIIVRLFEQQAPRTVASFVGLATGETAGRPAFDGTRFHRVIPNFMIQAGDGPSYENDGGFQFEVEPASTQRFDRPGLVAAANVGCQWFITEVAAPHLNRRHTVFGEVMKGFEIVPKIARKPVGDDGAPIDPVVIHRVSISRGAA